VKCRFTVRPTVVYNKEGVAEIAHAIAWFSPCTDIDEGNRVVFSGNNYEVISVTNKKGIGSIILYKRVILR